MVYIIISAIILLVVFFLLISKIDVDVVDFVGIFCFILLLLVILIVSSVHYGIKFG